jgi:hypothetical protein
MTARDPEAGSGTPEPTEDPPAGAEPSEGDATPGDPRADPGPDSAPDPDPHPDSDSHPDRRPEADTADAPAYDDWYRRGRAVLYAEMVLAVLVTVFSLYLAFTGTTGFLT